MIPAEDMDNASKLDLILDVLRANEMHLGSCVWLRVAKAQQFTTAYLVPKKCNCWLSVPAPLPLLPEEELRIDVFRNNGQFDMSLSQDPSVRITHLPTGITATVQDRSAIQAKMAAWREVTELVAAQRG
jgi:hypothetical protein